MRKCYNSPSKHSDAGSSSSCTSSPSNHGRNSNNSRNSRNHFATCLVFSLKKNYKFATVPLHMGVLHTT